MALAKGGGNPFYSPEEVDDDAFLNHPRAGSAGYMLPQHNSMTPSSSRQNSSSVGMNLEERQRQLLMKKKEIEESTLESSSRSLGLLYESEKVGAATAEELNRQKETLLKTEGRLDEINNTLKTSERHLNGIKSVFGGIKNYLFAKNAGLPSSQNGSSGHPKSIAQSNSDVAIGRTKHYMQDDDDRLEEIRESNHPALRSRGLIESEDGRPSVDQQLDRNLDEMSLGLSRLKGLALDLNSELEDHDDILNRLDDKAGHAGIKVTKQNKDMAKILKK